jgi:transcription elongation GreA/GreB family factor
MSDLKRELHHLCVNYVQNRIDTAMQAINAAQQAANEETKSSAGDKYETGRAMMQQLNEAKKLMVALSQVACINTYTTVETGSLVITSNGNFYIAVGAGTLNLNGEQFFAVSPASPIGLRLKGLKPGDQFDLNNKLYKVINIR